MAHYGTLGSHRFTGDVDDIRGADIYGSDDEKLGEIEDIIFDHSTGSIQYLVVDTGGWLSSRKFLVPGERVRERAGHDDDFSVEMTRQQVETLPAYREDAVNDEREFSEYDTKYRESWSSGPVLHKEGGVNIITPDPNEMPIASDSSDLSGTDLTPDRIADPMGRAEADPSKIRMRPSGTAARVEDTKRPGIAQNTSEAGWEQPEPSSSRDFSKDDRRISHVTDRRVSKLGERSNLRDFEASGDVDDIGYGDINRTVAPNLDTQYPPSYADTVDGHLDDTNDLNRPYPVQQRRQSRFQAFEDHLRRNRVDVTSSCRSCDVKKDKAA